MNRKLFPALFNVFLSLTLVVSLAPSFAWAEGGTDNGSVLTTTPQSTSSQSATPQASGPRKAPTNATLDFTGPAAKVGNTEYETLQEAIDAVTEDWQVVTALRDLNETAVVNGKKLFIDLDGHTWSGEGVSTRLLWVHNIDATVDVVLRNGTVTGFNRGNHLIELHNLDKTMARLTIRNCTFENNTVTANEDALFYLNAWNQEGSAWTILTFEDCKITNNTSESGKIIKINGSSYYYNQLNLTNTLVADNTCLYSTIQTSSRTQLNLKGSAIKNNVAKGTNNYDNTTGGIHYEAYKCTMENSAIYNNVLQTTSSYAKGTANDMYVYASARTTRDLSGILSASEMVDPFDPDFDFSEMVWKDGKSAGASKQLPEAVNAACFYTVMPASALQVAQINDDPDKIYESLEDAFAAAEDGDTIKPIAKEQYVAVSANIPVSKNVILDVNDHNIQFGGSGGQLFTVEDGGSLTLKNTQSDDDENTVEGGIESGSIFIKEGGSVTVEDPMLTNGFVNNGTLTFNAALSTVAVENNGELTFNKVIKTASVELGQGKVVQLGAAYANATTADTTINIKLPTEVLAALNNGTSAPVRVVEGGSEAILDAVVVPGITRSIVVKEFANGGVQMRVVKAIYLSGSGSNDKDGSSPTNAVQTFAKAKELLAADNSLDAIIICGEVPVADNQTWSLPAGKLVVRYEDYTGTVARVKNGGELTLKDVVIDGHGFVVRDSLLNVDAGGKLNIQDGAVLKDNILTGRDDFYRWGGGILSYGDITMTGGTISGNEAGYGGGIFQHGGSITMTGGTIRDNTASQVYVNEAQGWQAGAGGGVILVSGAKMTMGSTGTMSKPVISGNYARGEGGGIALGSVTHGGKGWFITYVDGKPVSKGTSLTMYGGIIDSNGARRNGGGVYVQDSMSAYIYGGAITNNFAAGGDNRRFSGGGIYVNGLHTIDDGRYMQGSNPVLEQEEKDLEHGFLYLDNAEITNNTANYLGGALATCNVSKTIIGDFATAIHDNRINNNGFGVQKTTGDNVDVYLSNIGHYDYGSITHPLAYVSNYMIGAGEYHWQDPDGVEASTDELYANTRPIYLHTPIAGSSDDMQKAIAGKKVLISGNYGGSNGGGLGSNGIIVFGSIAEKVDVAVAKSWSSATDAAKRPTSLKFNLYRAEGVNGEKKLYKEQVVKADENGAIAYTWKDLLKYVPGTNNKTEYVYTVEEDLTYVAKDANNNAIDLQLVYRSQATRIENDEREITRPQTDGTIKTSKQTIQQWRVLNGPNDPLYVSLPVAKTVETEVSSAPFATFTFELAPVAGQEENPMPEGAQDGKATLTINHSGTEKFAPICFSKPGSYSYTVREVDSKQAGYTYDTSAYTVTYVVTEDDDGVLDLTRTIHKGQTLVEEVSFKNTFTAESTTVAGLQVAKTLEGQTPATPATFDFVLEPAEDTNPMPAEAEGSAQVISVEGAGTASFGQITFDKEGAYTYTVREIATNAAGYTYDSAVYTVSYDVAVDAETAKLVATPTITKDDAAYAGTTLAFTNTYEHIPNTADGIVVAKHLAGDTPEHAQNFSFTLTPQKAGNPMPANAVDGAAEISIHGAEVGAFGTITFEAPGTYEYTVRETAGNATGYTYDSAEYTVVYTVTEGEKELNITHTVSKDGVAQQQAESLVFTNTFKHTPVQARIPVEKTISGNTPAPDETFAFTISTEGTADPLPATTRIEIKGAGTAEFGPITFDAPGTYKYNIEEVLGSSDGYTYDNSVHEVAFTVEEANGVLQASASYLRDGQAAESVTFNNIYTAPSAPVDVVLIKHLIDALVEPEEFGFALYDENNQQYGDIIYTTLGTHTNPAEDQYTSYVEIAFKDLVYYEPGIYNYTIREHMEGGTWVVEGDENNLKGFEPGYYKAGVKYDDKQYPVVVTVSENEEGKLVSEVDYPTAEGNVHELVNEYSKEYVEIDGNDSHPLNGKPADPEPEPSPTPEPTPTPQPRTPKPAPTNTPATKVVPKTGSARTADTNPVAPLTLAALAAAGTAGFAFARRRKHN